MADLHSITNLHDASNRIDTNLDSALAMPDPELAAFEEEQFDWDIPEIDSMDFTHPQMDEITARNFAWPPSSLSHDPLPVTAHTPQLQHTTPFAKVSIPGMPTFTSRSLIQRPRMEAGSQRSANLMLQTLISYPRMMLRHKTIPPFIHPWFTSLAKENDDMEPLNNCISLMNMVSGGVRGVRKLFWRNVQQECRRFSDDVSRVRKIPGRRRAIG